MRPRPCNKPECARFSFLARAQGIVAVFGVLAAGVSLAACGTPGRRDGGLPLGLRDQDDSETMGREAVNAPAQPMPLAGARCAGVQAATEGCLCRSRSDPGETEPPPAGYKRFEIRLAATGGRVLFLSEAQGTLVTSTPRERCFYVDIPVSTRVRYQFKAEADSPEEGIEPFLSISEYGPAGPYWYDVLHVTCRGPLGRCSREGADEWKESLLGRKRGRMDPCGSAVVTRLQWETSGGQHVRDGGLFRDFVVSFTMEVKPFATRFAPGSTECVPK